MTKEKRADDRERQKQEKKDNAERKKAQKFLKDVSRAENLITKTEKKLTTLIKKTQNKIEEVDNDDQKTEKQRQASYTKLYKQLQKREAGLEALLEISEFVQSAKAEAQETLMTLDAKESYRGPTTAGIAKKDDPPTTSATLTPTEPSILPKPKKQSLSQKLGLSTPPLKQIKTLNTKLAKINASTKKAEQKVELKATAYNRINAKIEAADASVRLLTDKLKDIDSTGRRVADVKAEKNQIKQQIQALKEQIQIDRKTRKTSLAEYNNAQKSQATLFEKNSKERASILASQAKIIKQNPEISDTVEKAPAAYKPKLHMLDSKKTIDTSEMKKDLEVATKDYKKQKAKAKEEEKDYDKKVSKLAKKTEALTKAERKEAPLRNKVAQTEAQLANNNGAIANKKQNLQLHQTQLTSQEQTLKDIRTQILSDNPGDLKALLKQEKALEKQIGKTQGLITTTEKQIAKYALKEGKLNITLTKQKEVLTTAQERKGFFSKGSAHHKTKVDAAKAQLMENAIAQRDATTKPHARTDAVHAQIDAELPRTIERKQSIPSQASSPTLQSDQVDSTPPNGNTRIYNPTAAQTIIITNGSVQDVLKSSMEYMQSVKWPDGNTKPLESLIKAALEIQKRFEIPYQDLVSGQKQLQSDYAALCGQAHARDAEYHTAWKSYYHNMGSNAPDGPLKEWCKAWEDHAASNAETAMKHANTNIAISEKIALDPSVQPSPLLEAAKVEVIRVETEVKKSKDIKDIPQVSEERAGDALQAAVDVAKEAVIGAAKPEQDPEVEGRPNTLKQELQELLNSTEVDQAPAVSAQRLDAINPQAQSPAPAVSGQQPAPSIVDNPSIEGGAGQGAGSMAAVAQSQPPEQKEAAALAVGGGAAHSVGVVDPVIVAKEAEPIHQTLEEVQKATTQSPPVAQVGQDHAEPDSNVPLSPPPPPPPLPPAPKMEVEERKPPAPSLPQTPDTLTASQDITSPSQIPKGFVQNMRAKFEEQLRTQHVDSSRPGAVLTSAPPTVGAQQQQQSVGGAGGAGGAGGRS